MWVRKSIEELEEDQRKSKHRRKNPVIPLAIGLFGALFELFYEPTLAYFLVSFFLVFALAYIGQLFFKDALMIVSVLFSSASLLEEPTDICSSCQEVKRRDKTKVCHCGGNLEPVKNWKWIERA